MSQSNEQWETEEGTDRDSDRTAGTLDKDQAMDTSDLVEDASDEQTLLDEDAHVEQEVAFVNQLEETVASLEKEINDYKQVIQRTQADFMNYKRRAQKEKIDITQFANEKIIIDSLELLDNFERALESHQGEKDGFYQGVDLIYKQFCNLLKRHGLTEIDALGQPFDPNFHHAVLQEEGDNPDTVTDVVQKGYRLKDKVIRPSMVKVAK